MLSDTEDPVLPLDLRFVLGATARDVATALGLSLAEATELLLGLEREGFIRRLGSA